MGPPSLVAITGSFRQQVTNTTLHSPTTLPANPGGLWESVSETSFSYSPLEVANILAMGGLRVRVNEVSFSFSPLGVANLPAMGGLRVRWNEVSFSILR